MAQFSLSDFKAQIFRKGLARQNRFEVTIPNPPVSADRGANRAVNLLVDSAQFPLLSLQTKPFKIFGPSYQMPYSSEYGGEGVPIQFHVDRDMTVKRFFDQWMEAIVVGGSQSSFAVNYQSNYTTDIQIKQLDEQENIVYGVTLIDAFPRFMNVLELSNSSQNETHKLNITFAFRYWKSFDSGRTAPSPAVTTRDAGPKIIRQPSDRNSVIKKPRGNPILSGSGTPVRSGDGSIVRTDPNR